MTRYATAVSLFALLAGLAVGGCSSEPDRTIYQEISFSIDGRDYVNPPYLSVSKGGGALEIDAADYDRYGLVYLLVRERYHDGYRDLSDPAEAIAWYRSNEDSPDWTYTTEAANGSGFIQLREEECWSSSGPDIWSRTTVTRRFCTYTGTFE
ncbi:MAG: hypothetical protein R3314_01040, partial [Longimicrobiales bacterium]|nr:hypothetical protein [Longimicrobiales bacterium]